MLCGRFAPSPTGPLHMGSLLTAVASYFDIKQRKGRWYVRIDDLDPPRQDANAPAQIIAALAAHGLHPDSPLDFQSNHSVRYEQAFIRLSKHIYYCNCTRSMLRDTNIYPGTCIAHTQPRGDSAIRLSARTTRPIAVQDTVFGNQQWLPGQDYGDFVIKRRDGLWAYNFATGVDDGTDFTHILRGQDLAHTTPLQIEVMLKLGLTIPTYTHIPLLCYPDGTKLSKQAHAPALDTAIPTRNLRDVFRYFGFAPPPAGSWTVEQWLNWGLEQWSSKQLPQNLPYFTSIERS